MGSESIIAELEKATEGLLFQSESDYPFKPFLWKGAAQEPLTPQTLLRLTGHPGNSSVETTTLDDLFSNCHSRSGLARSY